jgi:hypothetical protein
MDCVENSLRIAQQYQESDSSNTAATTSTTNTDEFSNEKRFSLSSSAKYSSYFRLYEYQIVEMQHEYELLLEDKVSELKFLFILFLII